MRCFHAASINSIVLGISTILVPASLWADTDLRYENASRFSSDDYLLRSNEDRDDPVFDKYETVDLSVNLGVGSDCGKVDFRGTMRAALKNMLDAKYFGDLGRNIMAASPLLATCYFSPTWCAILKQSHLNANLLSQMRLDQCALIDRYTDSRVEDYYQERQSCVRQRIKNNDGNLEEAMEGCDSMWSADLADWTGKTEKSEENRLIESSAKWAGYEGEDNQRAIDLVKSLVGDTQVTKGRVSIDYGPRRERMSAAAHLKDLERSTFKALCEETLGKVIQGRGHRSIDQIVSDSDLRNLTPGTDAPAVDRQTIESLSYMSGSQRMLACRKLADGIALSAFTRDLERSLDILTTAAQNPHLPPHRKAEIEEKRRALKDSIEMTVALKEARNEPLNKVLTQINQEGARLRGEATGRVLRDDANRTNSHYVNAQFFDCADFIMCQGR